MGNPSALPTKSFSTSQTLGIFSARSARRVFREQSHLGLNPLGQRRRIVQPNHAIFHVASINHFPSLPEGPDRLRPQL